MVQMNLLSLRIKQILINNKMFGYLTYVYFAYRYYYIFKYGYMGVFYANKVYTWILPLKNNSKSHKNIDKNIDKDWVLCDKNSDLELIIFDS